MPSQRTKVAEIACRRRGFCLWQNDPACRWQAGSPLQTEAFLTAFSSQESFRLQGAIPAGRRNVPNSENVTPDGKAYPAEQREAFLDGEAYRKNRNRNLILNPIVNPVIKPVA